MNYTNFPENYALGKVPETVRYTGDACEAKRATAAAEMIKFSEELANLAEMLVHKIDEKLAPYSLSIPRDAEKRHTAREMPPYFEGLHGNLTRIANAINEAGNLVHSSEL